MDRLYLSSTLVTKLEHIPFLLGKLQLSARRFETPAVACNTLTELKFALLADSDQVAAVQQLLTGAPSGYGQQYSSIISQLLSCTSTCCQSQSQIRNGTGFSYGMFRRNCNQQQNFNFRILSYTIKSFLMKAHQRKRRLKKSKFVVILGRLLTSAGREKTSRR